VRRVLDQIRGRSYEEAIMILEYMPYKVGLYYCYFIPAVVLGVISWWVVNNSLLSVWAALLLPHR